MLIDARTLPQHGTLETEICIIGSGPAGLTLAHQFVGQGVRVSVLESGQLEADQATQSLAAGETIGDPYAALDDLRHRRCGGTANSWSIELRPDQFGVRYGQLDAVDFETRDWLPHSGWPIALQELESYYKRAQEVCQLGPFNYDANGWADDQNPVLPMRGDRVHTTMFQFSPSAVFTQVRRDEVAHADNINIYLNANVVELETDESNSTIQRVKVACLSGNQFWVSARIVVLAAGGLENARLMLLSNRHQRVSLGNEYDVVGRYFMDHPLIYTGELIPHDRQIFNRTTLYDRRLVKGTWIMGKLALTNEAMRREKVMNYSAILFPRYGLYRSEPARSLKRVVKGLRSGNLSSKTLVDLAKATLGVGDIAMTAYRQKMRYQLPEIPGDLPKAGWSGWDNKPRKFNNFEVISQSEQAPDPDNRVTLSHQLDALGCPKTQLHWRWREIDIEHVRRAQDILVNDLARSGIGQLRLDRTEGIPKIYHPTSHHHMGTTRMHNNPRHGVVDADCKVHSVSNLFVAGSSVFTTGGYANPTLTIVALAVRLADHLKNELTTLNSVTLPTQDSPVTTVEDLSQINSAV